MTDTKAQLKLKWQTCFEAWDSPINATSVVYDDHGECLLSASKESIGIGEGSLSMSMDGFTSEPQAQLAAERIYGAITAELDAMRKDGVL